MHINFDQIYSTFWIYVTFAKIALEGTLIGLMPFLKYVLLWIMKTCLQGQKKKIGMGYLAVINRDSQDRPP